MLSTIAICWCMPDDEAFARHPQFLVMVAKLECFLCASDQVEASEILDYLPQPDSCKWVRDRVNHVFSCTESLGVLMSHAGLACGDFPAGVDLAARHAKAACTDRTWARFDQAPWRSHQQQGDCSIVERSTGGCGEDDVTATGCYDQINDQRLRSIIMDYSKWHTSALSVQSKSTSNKSWALLQCRGSRCNLQQPIWKLETGAGYVLSMYLTFS